MDKIEKSLKSMIEAEEGIYFYDTQVAKENDETIYRVFIKRIGENISIEDCVKITHIISPFLDVEEPISGHYRLEVSSPGIERRLEKDQHFKLSIGENVEITLEDKSKFEGKLLSFDGEKLSLETEHGLKTYPLSEVKKAKVVFHF
jgi:ribosome maturation factor RimP